MKKIVLLTCIFLFPFFASADVLSENICTGNQPDDALYYNADTYAVGKIYTVPKDMYISSSTFRVAWHGDEPSDAVLSTIYSVDSSNNLDSVLADSNFLDTTDGILEDTYTYLDFEFDNFFIASGTKIAIVLRRSGSYSINSQYRYTYSCGDSGIHKIWKDNLTIYKNANSNIAHGVYYINDLPEENSTSTDYATSTVEAIYTTARMRDIYEGIVIMLMFGFLSFNFFKGFL